MLIKKKKKTGCFTYFFIFFGIPFALAGIFLGVKAVRNFSDAYSMKNWQQVPAKIISAELKENRSDKSTTFSVDVVYQYQFSGKNYKGSKVNITGGGQSGSYYPDLFQKLEKCKNSGEKYRCFVNPNNPGESIINNKLRVVDFVIFPAVSILFGGVGIVLIIFGFFTVKNAKICNNLLQQNPEKPWLHTPEWANGKIISSNRLSAFFALFFAIFWNLISWPVAIAFIPEILKEKEYFGLFVLLFPLAGFGLIIWAVVSLRRWKKYGESVFGMQSNPGVVGGALKGIILTKVNIESDEGFKVELNCVNRYRSGRGKNRKTSERILWQDTYFIKHEIYKDDLTKSAIPVLFKIPFDSRETNEDNPGDAITWRVKISAKVPGVDYKAHFEIPVFKTEDSREDFELDSSLLKKYIEEPTQDSLFSSSRIILEKLMNGGERYTFPTAWKQSVFLLLFTIAWSGVVIFLWTRKDAPMMLKIILSVVVPLLIYGFLDLILYKSEVTAHDNSLSILSGWLGFRSEKKLEASDISEIKAKSGMQSGKKIHHSIIVTTNSGETVVLTKRVDNLRQAEFIINEINKVMNLIEKVPHFDPK